MNYAIVFRLLSYILFCEAALLLLPATASLCYGGVERAGRLCAYGGTLPGAGVAAAADQALQQGVLHAGGLCHHGPELGRHQYHGGHPLCAHGLHPQPGGCHV